MTPPATPPTRHLPGLDAWRSGLMIGGLFFHALPEGSGGMVFGAIHYLSSHFRMGAFFAISGFLTGLVSHRRCHRGWAMRRLPRLALPLLTGLLITIPAMAIMVPPQISGSADLMWFLLRWYHLWFLAALILFLPLSSHVAFGRAGERLRAALNRFAATTRHPHLALAMLLALACEAGLTFGGGLAALLPAAGLHLLHYGPLMLCYAPIYTIAILCGRFEDVQSLMLGNMKIIWTVLVICVTIEWVAPSVAPSGWGDTSLFITAFNHAVLPAMGALLVLRSALRVRKVPAWVMPICDAAMTIYIVHLPLVQVCNRLLPDMPMQPQARYLQVVVIAGVLSWLFHEWAIRSSNTLHWLFNGRAPFDAAYRRPL